MEKGERKRGRERRSEGEKERGIFFQTKLDSFSRVHYLVELYVVFPPTWN